MFLRLYKIAVIRDILSGNLNFLDNISKIFKYQISRKSVYWKLSCSLLMDRRADRKTR